MKTAQELTRLNILNPSFLTLSHKSHQGWNRVRNLVLFAHGTITLKPWFFWVQPMLYIHSHAQCHWEKRTGVFVQAHWGRLQIAWANVSKDSSSFSSSSILPDHFGATFVDLHVHHTARVNIGSQVDLWELRLGNTRKKAQPEIRWHVPQQQTEKGQVCP